MNEEVMLDRQVESAREELEALRDAAGPTEARPRVVEEVLETLSVTVEELQVANKELKSSNNQLVAARQELEAERQRYRELFEFAPDVYLVTDAQTIILQANRVAAETFRVSQNYLIGKPLVLFVPEENQGEFFGHLERLQAGREESASWGMRMRPRAARGAWVALASLAVPFHAAVRVTAVRDPQGELSGLYWLIRDVTAQKQLEREQDRLVAEVELGRQRAEDLARSSQTAGSVMHTLIETAPVGVVISDATGGILLVNPAAREIFGGPVTGGVVDGYVLRRPDGSPLSPEETPLLRAIEQGEVTQGREMLVRRGDGEERFILAAGAPVRDESGDIVTGVGLYQDVTDRRRAQERLRQYAGELQSRNEELRAFAHTVAHDLKNPLSIIIGFSEQLARDVDEMAREEMGLHLGRIARRARKMGTIIDELLLLAGVREVEVEMEPLDMGEIVEEALERLAPNIEEREAEIARPEGWPVALGHAPWVEEIWFNYVGNALKYGGEPPRIELGATRPSEAGSAGDSQVRFWVRDHGPGIPEEEQENLFIPFTQVAEHANGYGLGLSIVQRIVDRLGGQVGVESEPGEGSTFWFSLPPAGDGP